MSYLMEAGASRGTICERIAPRQGAMMAPESRSIGRILVDKLRIIGLEGSASSVTVEAQFNPKEISVDKSVPWQKQKAQGPGVLELSVAEPMTMSLVLMFDVVEGQISIQVR